MGCETNLWKIIGCESSDVVKFDLGPLLQGQIRVPKFKSAYNSLIIVRRDLKCETMIAPAFGARSVNCSLALVTCLFGGYNFYHFSDALDPVCDLPQDNKLRSQVGKGKHQKERW